MARRLARAEAREIRMRELEKQQKEMEENADRQFASEGGAGDVHSYKYYVIWRYLLIFLFTELNPKLPSNRNVSTSGPPLGSNRPILTSTGSFQSSRRGSEDSSEEISGQTMTFRDLRVPEFFPFGYILYLPIFYFFFLART